MEFWHIFLLLLTTSEAAKPRPDPKCKNLNVSLTQKIDNEGFHRELHWLLERGSESFQCRLALKFDVGKDMYLNPDQIAELNRVGEVPIYISGNVDVEVPAHLAEAHTAYIFMPPFVDKVPIKLPFHLRYQRAQISGGFGKVIVNKPSVLAICPKPCARGEIRAPCDVRNTARCGWNNVSYQALFDEVELLVPVGDLDDYPLVSIVTLLLGCAGCIYTLSVLSTTPL